MRRCRPLSDQPPSTKRAVSQSSSSGWVGSAPRRPKLLGVAAGPLQGAQLLLEAVDHGLEALAGLVAAARQVGSFRPGASDFLESALEVGQLAGRRGVLVGAGEVGAQPAQAVPVGPEARGGPV